MPTLEEYIRNEYAEGKIDFTFRASIWPWKGGPVTIYIHPLGKDGQTTPNLTVEGDTVRISDQG
jgi:hypothetical protein